jgi:hypothetical protein
VISPTAANWLAATKPTETVTGIRSRLKTKSALATASRKPLGKLEAVLQAADGESVKLLASIAADLILMPLGGPHHLREADQDVVPGLMAMGVVHRLEMIQVQQQKDKVVDVTAAEIADIDLDDPLEDGAFRQLGQFVEIADFLQQILLLHLLGDLGQAANGETDPVLDKDLDVGLVLQPDRLSPGKAS